MARGLSDTITTEELAKFMDDEDVILKIHAIQEAERHCAYQPQEQHRDYWSRVQRAVQFVPKSHWAAAYAIFASVVYITAEMRIETSRLISANIARWARAQDFHVPNDVHIFAVDHDSLRDQFYRHGDRYGWQGRMDRSEERHYPKISHLLDAIELRLKINGSTRDDVMSDLEISKVLNKKAWVLLNDNALSGGSAESEISRMHSILDLLRPEARPEIVVGVQVITDQAILHLKDSLDISEDRIFYGLRFDDRSRICSDRCELFSHGLIEPVRSLCRWFGQRHFPGELQMPLAGFETERDKMGEFAKTAYDQFLPTLAKHRDRNGDINFAFGWRDGGYTIVDFANSPTNSVPLLWYPPDIPPSSRTKSNYVPPFPRTSSRRLQNTSGDSARMIRLVNALSDGSGVRS